MRRKRQIFDPVLKVGITGGIGSGKTTVCKMFEELGIPVYSADDRAKYLMQHEHYLIDQIMRNFGNEVYENGKLNRKLLADKVFNDPAKLKVLNSLVHPAVFRDTERWVEEQQSKHPAYVLEEAALIVETGAYKTLDKLIVVSAPLKTRVDRVSDRDKIETEEIMARVRHQLPEDEKLKLADFIIRNDGTLEELQEQVYKVHEQLLALSETKAA